MPIALSCIKASHSCRLVFVAFCVMMEGGGLVKFNWGYGVTRGCVVADGPFWHGIVFLGKHLVDCHRKQSLSLADSRKVFSN